MGYLYIEPTIWRRTAKGSNISNVYSTADYSSFRIPFSKAYVLKRPHEWKKDWREKGYKGILVVIDDSAYKIWVPELGAAVVSTNVVIDELATGELEQGETYKNLS